MGLFRSPTMMMIVAVILLVLGIVLPFLMMMQLLQSTFLLNFLAYFASLSGLVLGLIGTALNWQGKDKEDDYFGY